MKKVILLCLLAGSVYGEPSQAVKWLMTEPMTLWDWGMVRLQEQVKMALNSERVQFEHWMPLAYYNPDTDEIIIGGFPVAGRAETSEEAREICEAAVKWLRVATGVDFLGQSPLVEGVNVMGAGMLNGFSHASQVMPSEYGNHLLGITKIVISVEIADGRKVTAVTPLLGGDISFREE